MKKHTNRLEDLEQKKVLAGLRKLAAQGITAADWLNLLNAHPTQMHVTSRSFPKGTGVSCNAKETSRLLGLPSTHVSRKPPHADDGEVVFWYDGWDPQTLLCTSASKKHIFRGYDLAYDFRQLQNITPEPGYFRVMLAPPRSNMKSSEEQLTHLTSLPENWEPTRAIIALAAVLIDREATGKNRFEFCHAVRCADTTLNGKRAELTLGRWLTLGLCPDGRGDHIYMAACLKY